MDDLRRLGVTKASPTIATPDTPDTLSSSPPRPVMNTERIVRNARDTVRLDEDDVIPPRVPRAAWIAIAALGVVALVFAAFAAGVHFAR